MARNRARLTKAITLKMVKPFMPWAPGAYAAFDFQQDRAFWTEPRNLLGYTEAFDNAAWTVANATITANAAVAPDGTTTADLLYENTANSQHSVVVTSGSRPTISTGSHTITIYAKAGTRGTAALYNNGTSGGAGVAFNLTSGTITETGGTQYISSSIQALASDWYRVSLTFNSVGGTSGPTIYLGTSFAGQTYTGDGTSGIYIWGAQLEKGSTATAYQANPNAAPTIGNSGRISPLSGVPGWTFTRASTGYALDLAGNLVSFASGALRRTDRGVLIEGSRTNLCLQSQALATSPWTAISNGTGSVPVMTNNYGVAPDGTMTATRVQCALNGGTSTADYSFPAQILTGTSCRGSFYIKTADGSSKVIYMRGLNSTTVAVTGEWARYDFDAGTLSGTQFAIGLRGGQAQACSDSCDILVWGAQLEAASFASSYIPTTTASVTRAADALSITGVSGITYPLTLFGEAEWSSTSGSIMQIDAGSSVDRVVLSVETGQVVQASMTSGGAGQGSSTSAATIAAGQIFKAAGRYGTNTIRVCLNAVLASEDVSATVPAQPNAVRIGMNHSSVAQGFVYLKRLAIWTSAFTDAQLQTQTS